MPRMKIFNALEEAAFETPPVFNTAERKRYFTLPAGLHQLAATLRTPTNQVCFTLAAGYFRARRKFFAPLSRPADVAFVASRLGLSPTTLDPADYDRATSRRHQRLIAGFFGYQEFDEAAELQLRRELAPLVRAQIRPKLILRTAVQALVRHKTVLPGYNTLANLLVCWLNEHKQHLIDLVAQNLTPRQRQLLDKLLEKEGVATATESAASADTEVSVRWHRYRLTLLKKPFQSTKPGKIKANVADFRLLRDLYREVENVVTALGLTRAGLRYFATSVLKAEVFQMTRRSAPDRYLHLLAFIAEQTFRLQDTLAETLLQTVQNALNATQREHKELVYAEREERHLRLQEVVTGLDQHLLQAFADIAHIVSDEGRTATLKVEQIGALVAQARPRTLLLEEQVQRLQTVVEENAPDQKYFLLLRRRSLKLPARVADIARELSIDEEATVAPLQAALRHFQEHGGHPQRNAPVDFLAPREQAALVDDAGKFQPALYKMFLFAHLAAGLKAGQVNLRYSHRYRSLDDYLLPPREWAERRAELLQEAGLDDWVDAGETLARLSVRLDEQHRETNRRLREEANQLLKMRPDGSFHVTTPKQGEEGVAAAPLSRLFPERRYVSLLEVLHTVQQAAGFLDEFAHWQQTHHKSRPTEKTFYAGIIGYGCDIGPHKIAYISREISEHELDNTVHWYFSVPALHAAKDRILALLERLELPRHYRRESDRRHTSSDGQKFEIAVESLHANYSFKYFGQNKGVTVYSFIDERHLLFHSTVISSSAREAAYVIDAPDA